MTATKLQRHSSSLIKKAHIYLAGCAVPLLISLWFGPFSTIYFSGSALISLAFTSLTIIYWKRPSTALNFAGMMLVLAGEHFLRDLAFTDITSRSIGLILFIEYLSLVFTVFFAVLALLRTRVRQYLRLELEDGLEERG